MRVPLYKYHKCGDMFFLKQLLETNSFYLASQKKMNDIFDCHFSLSESYILSQFKDIPLQELKEEGRFLFRDWVHRKVLKDFDLGITCFSECKDNDILWSYYSDASKGICMEFDFSSENPEFQKAIRKVKYCNNFIINTNEDLDILPFRKKVMYEKEQEWRIVTTESGKRLQFNKSSLRSIYIGIRCRQNDIMQIMNLTEENAYEVKFYKMDVSPNSNNIEFVETNREDMQENWSDI